MDEDGCAMNADDRQLINGLFERMRNVGALDKDHDAEAFIHDSMRQNPDSPYLLVQSVLVQEQALQRADERIKALEAELAEKSAPAGAQPAAWETSRPASGSGSYVGPRSSAGFGGGNGAAASAVSSVPAAGRAPWQSSQRPGAGQGAGAGAGQGRGAEQRQAGGGFMAQAMTTAAGVAGGMLLASGISSLFSGSGSASAATPTATETATDSSNATSGSEQPQQADAVDQAPSGEDQSAVQDASYEDDGGWGDWGGDDDWGSGLDL
jgi:hypothetical protein